MWNLPKKATRLVAMAALVSVAAANLAAPASAAPTGERLRNLAGNFLIGYAAMSNFNTASDAAQYQEVARTEFNFVTPENAMKWDATEPSQNSFSFGTADTLVSFAQTNSQKLHGHTLVWHSQLPSWVSNGSWTSATLTNVMYNHIDKVMNHWTDGQIYAWDVVNEAFDDSGVRRTSVFQNVIGSSYIELAFQRARAADPVTKLIYNDYNIETVNSKSNAVYNMIADFKSRGVPIDGVGFQMHLTNGGISYTSLAQNMQRFADLGVEVYITEMDVRYPTPTTSTDMANQATIYQGVLDVCLKQPMCKALQVWGIPDKYSWVPNTFSGQGDPLLFDNSYNPKPAYYAIQARLASQSGTPTATPVTPTATTPTPVTPTTTPVTPTPVTPTPVTPTPSGAACQVSYVVNQWNTGFTANVTLKNNSATAISAWTVGWTFAGNQQISNAWNATVTQTGTSVSAKNMSYNASIPAGGSTSFGFQASYSGTNATPTSFTLNGTACTIAQ